MKRTSKKFVASVAVAAVAAAGACAGGARGAAPSQRIHVAMASLVSGEAQLTLKVWARGLAQHVILADADLELPDGSWNVTSYNGGLVWGTFTVEGGVVTAATGSVVVRSAGHEIRFDPAALCRVATDTTNLKSPWMETTVKLAEQGETWGGVAVVRGTKAAVCVPAGTLHVRTYSGEVGYGSFSVSPELAVTEPNGAIVVDANRVAFDPAKLCEVELPPLTSADSYVVRVLAGADGLAVNRNRVGMVRVPAGQYSVARYDDSKGAVIATFDVETPPAGGPPRIVRAGGAYALRGSGRLALRRHGPPRVWVASGSSMQLTGVTSWFRGDHWFVLVPGKYAIDFGNGPVAAFDVDAQGDVDPGDTAKWKVTVERDPFTEIDVDLRVPSAAQAGAEVDLACDVVPSAGTKVTRVTWNFGDGSSATGPAAKHTWRDAGIYEVKCTVETDAWTVDRRTARISIDNR